MPYGVPGPPRLWHDAGRSACGPVHWPLRPAPLPPLVGGLGSAQAAGASPTQRTPAAIRADTSLRIRDTVLVPPLDRQSSAAEAVT
jgi:hypothetical protein